MWVIECWIKLDWLFDSILFYSKNTSCHITVQLFCLLLSSCILSTTGRFGSFQFHHLFSISACSRAQGHWGRLELIPAGRVSPQGHIKTNHSPLQKVFLWLHMQVLADTRRKSQLHKKVPGIEPTTFLEARTHIGQCLQTGFCCAGVWWSPLLVGLDGLQDILKRRLQVSFD